MFSFHWKHFVYQELKRAPQKLSFCVTCPDTGAVRILGNILYRDRDDLTINTDDLTESQLVEIAAKPINIIFDIIYRPMNNKLVKFKECLAELLQKLDDGRLDLLKLEENEHTKDYKIIF